MATNSSARRGDTAVLGEGLQVRGRVRGEGDLRVLAQVEGDIVVAGQLSLEQGSRVTGTVQGETVVVLGTLTGDAKAESAVNVGAGAAMQGDVHAPRFSLELGGSFEGRIEADFDLPESIA